MTEELRHRDVQVGVRLHVVEAGVAGRPLVVLLHGFPEFWWSWRHQIRALSSAGFHVMAPDMRGFHLSEQPRSVREYRLDRLEADVAGLVRACGADKAVVVGHDWGALVAWSFAQNHPEMVERLVILNVPHPQRFLQDGLRSRRQLKKSWYVLFFQIPWLPERWICGNDFRNLRRFFAGDKMAPADVQEYVDAVKRAGSLRGGVNYYRASIRQVVAGTLPEWKRIEARTLVIWGEKDRFLGKELAAPDPALVPNARVELLKNASHWVQQDAPERVNELLLEFLADLAP